MCGICMLMCPKSSLQCKGDKVKDHIQNSRLKNRGPDIQNISEVAIIGEICGLFYGSTLHFRGEPTEQPLQDEHGNLLLWNGEIFRGISVQSDENDGAVLLNLLSATQTEEEILCVFAKIQGPWSFIYFQASKKRLWFGRDIFGRRSLLLHLNEECKILASIAFKPWSPWREIPAVGIFCAPLHLEESSLEGSFHSTFKNILLFPWAEPADLSSTSLVLKSSDASVFNKTLMLCGNLLGDDVIVTEGQYKIQCPLATFNTIIPNLTQDYSEVQEIPSCVTELACDSQKELSHQLVDILQEAVLLRTKCQSTKCSDCIKEQLHSANTARAIPTDISNDVISKCKTDINFEQCPSNEEFVQMITAKIAENEIYDDEIQAKSEDATGCAHSRVAILFSGGVDSLIIAALADRCVPSNEPIDLLNVAFEQAKKLDAGKGKRIPSEGTKIRPDYIVPDRLTGRDGLKQLQQINPHRHYNFVEINIPIEDLKEARSGHVKDLVYPLNTVLDDSIGCAIWFASRGQGIIHNQSGNSIPYTSPARIVLVGMGADEQFAGYSRHRAKFNSDGWSGLVDEIQMEIERISSRNLGRDDRVISDHGRESRFPFLDENVVSFLNKLPLASKTNLHLPRGLGEKFLLRLAAESIGLTKGAVAPKRAIQFGSRIAKAENHKEKGSDKCDRLQD